jgi:hypothetical protein
MSKSIIIKFTDGETKTIVVSTHRDGRPDVRLYDSEDWEIIHFGRDAGNGWTEVLAAPVRSVLWWTA